MVTGHDSRRFGGWWFFVFSVYGPELKFVFVYRYWKIPFDPLRECVLTDHKIFKIDKLESENEQDISLSQVG